MRMKMPALALALLVAAGACSRSNNRTADSALNTDLSLAAQQSRSLDSLSAAERSPAPNALATTNTPTNATSHPVAHSTRSSATHRSSSGSSGGHVYSSGGTVSSGHVVKHTQRDAAIGAAAGAIIGATTSRNKVKGGVIGAAVGGILGGVIGNNVDKKKVP